eukprot:NODE_296_length_1691_cov_322.152200.p1 GENE.NODE_296_length_1691_cov_322.152200~~NODE_296_length_1691_cov_322.152200.p1  ORF type:complete len:496 (+),score=102.32 NODE_296_length_1691_cov_322.152200:3-1490(+)
MGSSCGLPSLARDCRAAAQNVHEASCTDAAAPMAALPAALQFVPVDTASLLSGSQQGSDFSQAASSGFLNEVLPFCCRHASTCWTCGSLDRPVLGFLWALLPPYLERASAIAALAASARGPCQALHDGQRLRVGHLHVHPNSLAPAGPQCPLPFGGPKSGGCFSRISFAGLVSVKFYLPHLISALWLLDGLARSGCCRSLRKIVDRQCRWLPRTDRLENLDGITQQRCAALADLLGTALPSLHTLEGPVFSLLLRARATVRRHKDAADPQADLASTAAPGADTQSMGCRVEVLQLLDLCAVDLHGLWEPLYSKLQRLILLNLPSPAPGETTMAVSKFLPKAPNLEELQLDFQYFDPSLWELEPLDELVSIVQKRPSKIRKLVLEWCRLGDAGVDCVCQALARHTRQPDGISETGGGVEELSLAHCELRDTSSVCALLATPGLALTKLDISSNGLGDCQARRLAEVLPVSNVKELLLRDSQVSIPLPVKTKWFWGS